MPEPTSDHARLSVASGPPLNDISGLIGGPGVDDLPRHAARRAPDRCALLAPSGALTFAELDDQVTRCAAALHGLLGRFGAIVAVAAVLDPAFAVAYYGIARSGNISAVVNPLLMADGLEHALRASGAEAAIVTPQTWERLRPIRDRLPRLRHVVLIGESDGNTGILSLTDFMARNTGRKSPVTSKSRDDVACIVFTSGTTGAPKAVPLTHRNVVVNAAQTVHAQSLDSAAVMFNYLPTFHTMHLNAGLAATATQVLHLDNDIAFSVETAARYAATHYYSLPMRLSRLAADPRLPDLALPSARALLSGGSALPPPTAAALSRHFEIPVVQGYGFAEASPLTNFNRLADPRPGSCGQPIAGTECRVVDIGSRQVLPLGEKGELQIRGPQLMAGYLDQETPEMDGAGWFSTGDVGYLGVDGHLFLTDRIKDVFKCDNFLVSPTEVENILRQHPAVADCAVVDCPDEFSGAVAYGLVVLRGRAVDPVEVKRAVNAQMPYYMHLSYLEPVDEILKSPHGKVLRRELRERVQRRGQSQSWPSFPA